jgi:hypothetical protein
VAQLQYVLGISVAASKMKLYVYQEIGDRAKDDE